MIKNIIICLCTCALFAGVQVCSCKRRRNVTACAVQYMDNNKKDFFSPIFFRRSTDTHTPKLFQCNCAMYVLQI